MKTKFIAVLTALISTCAAAVAQDDMGLDPQQMVIGHTVTNSIDMDDSFIGEAGKYTLGARFSGELLEPYVGCKVVGVRFAIGVPQGRTRAFLCNVKGDNVYDLAAKNVNAVAGWNKVIFSEPFTIAEGDDLFYGYDYVETAEMAASEKGGICSVAGGAQNGALLYSNGVFLSISEIGNLCVQLIIDATSLTPYNMNIGFFDTGFKYKHIQETFEVFTQLMNNGSDVISSFRIGWAFDSDELTYKDINSHVAPGSAYTWQEALPYPSWLGVGRHTLRVVLVSAEGKELPAGGKKEHVQAFCVYRDYCRRRHEYFEVYADQYNVLTSLQNDVLATLPSSTSGMMCIAQVYPKGSVLECNISGDLFDRYAYTTPCFTSNRALFPGENFVAYDFNDYFGVFPNDLFHGILEGIVEQDYEMPTFADIALEGKYDEGARTVTVKATIDSRYEEVQKMYGNLALNLLVIENDVLASQYVLNPKGTAIMEQGAYLHPNVVRHACFGTDGIKVETSGQPVVIEHTITLPAAWDASNVRIVGILTPYHAPGEVVDLSDLDVINCDTLPVSAMEAGVAAVAAPEGNPEFYTLDGIPASRPLAPGIYIARYPNGVARKLLVK